MKKFVVLWVVFLFLTASVVAQDYIYMRHQEGRIATSIIDVLSYETIYKVFGEESGQILSIQNNEISMITFENGDVRFFEKEERVINRNNYNKNIIHYHLFDLIVNNFKLSYERIISQGKIGIQIPIAIGYGDGDNISGFDNVYNRFYTGLTVNFYPTGQGKIRYFMGPALQIGTGYFKNSYYDPYGGYSNKLNINTFVLRFLVNNGIIFTPIKTLSISLVGSLGIRYTDKTKNLNDNNVKTVGAFATNLSYRF